jgi:hypothetical protein
MEGSTGAGRWLPPLPAAQGAREAFRRTGRTGLDPGTRTIGRPVTCVSTARRARIRHHLGGPYFALDSLAYARCPTYKPRHESQPLAYAKYGKLVDGFPLAGRRVQSPPAVGPGGPSFSRVTRERSLLRALPRPPRAASALSETRHRPVGALGLGVLGPTGYCATLGDAATDRVPGRATRSAALWSSFGTSRGRPWRGSSTARAMLCSTDSRAALASTAIGAAMAVVAALRLWTARGARGQRPSVLCEIRSQLRSL